jgi:hypothetical protein
MVGAARRVGRVQRLCLGLLQIFQDDGRFENRVIADQEHRRLAERRDVQEPVRLMREIDIDALEGRTLFGERDHCALHIRAKLVADQFERGGHGSPTVRCNCIKLNAIA